MVSARLELDEETLEEIVDRKKKELRDRVMTGFDPDVYADPEEGTRIPVSWHGPVSQAVGDALLSALADEHDRIDDAEGLAVKAIHIEAEKASHVELIDPEDPEATGREVYTDA